MVFIKHYLFIAYIIHGTSFPETVKLDHVHLTDRLLLRYLFQNVQRNFAK